MRTIYRRQFWGWFVTCQIMGWSELALGWVGQDHSVIWQIMLACGLAGILLPLPLWYALRQDLQTIERRLS